MDKRDIAHALSMLCRFGGHCDHFYSVAEHSVHACSLALPHLKLMALLHDAAEAYLCDIPRPIKKFLVEYKKAETAIEFAIYEHFGINPKYILPRRVDIKEIDNAVLMAEAAELMGPPPVPWVETASPAYIQIRGWEPWQAEAMFLETLEELV